jgi:hypothetical protein
MAQIAGRLARSYLGATNASPATKISKWTVSAGSDFLETTAQGDTSKTYVVGLPDAEVKVDAFFDDTYFTLMDAAFNQTTLKWYGYPSTATATSYFYGTMYVSMDSHDTDVGDVEKQSFTLKPTDALTFKHA